MLGQSVNEVRAEKAANPPWTTSPRRSLSQPNSTLRLTPGRVLHTCHLHPLFLEAQKPVIPEALGQNPIAHIGQKLIKPNFLNFELHPRLQRAH